MFLRKNTKKVSDFLLKYLSYFQGRKCYPLAVIMAPTRELAIQIHEESRKVSLTDDLPEYSSFVI